MNKLPILYSFRRCPYAMRARLGLRYAQIRYELREVILRDKPAEMIAVSPKATVPVLQLPAGQVIDESYDIIKWAIGQNDPDGWQEFIARTDELVKENDGPFKLALDKYKYASRWPEFPPVSYREQGELFLKKLDRMLQGSVFLLDKHKTMADIAIFPFIRQFAHVDKAWFRDLPYPHLQRWLMSQLDSDIFKTVMKKYPAWHAGDKPLYFPDLYQGLHSPLGAPCN